MSSLLLDTTVLIDVLRGRPAVGRLREVRSRGDVAVTSAVNVEEVVRGLRPSEAAEAQHLFEGLLVVPVDRAAAEIAGAWRRDHARVGVTLSQADCLVAACARRSGGALATGNTEHFPMSGIRVEEWPVGL